MGKVILLFIWFRQSYRYGIGRRETVNGAIVSRTCVRDHRFQRVRVTQS